MTISTDQSPVANEPSLAGVLTSPALLLASVGGAGLSPVAPGTVGSAVTVPLAALLLQYTPMWVVIMTIATVFFVGVWSAGAAGRRWGQVDHGAIVIDEMAGQLIAIALPFYVLGPWLSWWGLLVGGFVAFRLFDIVKPWPADYFDRRSKNGWGVMMDDVVAGGYAALVVCAAVIVVAAI